jgi:hypothetical protein
VTFPAIFDADPFLIGQSYDVTAVPHTFLIDQNMVIKNVFFGFSDCNVLKNAIEELLPSVKPQGPIFVFSVAPSERLIPRWIKVAYLILSIKTQNIFKKIDVCAGDRFNKVVAKYLQAYIDEGKMPPADIATAILNLADDYMAGKIMNLRAGDYIAIQNHIRASREK